MNKNPKICQSCGDKFYKKSSESKRYWETKKYCSSKCSLTVTSIKISPVRYSFPIGHNVWNKGKKLSTEQKSKLDLSGLVLGRTKGIKHPTLQGKNNPRWNSIEKECIVCSQKFLVQKYRAEKARFCSHDCWHKWHRGVNSPVWTDNYKQRFRQRIWQLPEYAKWRNSVRERDGWKCVKCGAKSNLEADHIKPLYYLLKKYNVTKISQIFAIMELWDVNNGRTLCRSCHRATDTYGKQAKFFKEK